MSYAGQVNENECFLRFADSLLCFRAQEIWKAQSSESKSADAQEGTSRKAIAVVAGGLFGKEGEH